jgi:uncharacterized membrane protein
MELTQNTVEMIHSILNIIACGMVIWAFRQLSKITDRLFEAIEHLYEIFNMYVKKILQLQAQELQDIMKEVPCKTKTKYAVRNK